MRILMASFTFPPNKDGVAEAASAIVSAFLTQGWAVDVLTLPAAEPRESRNWNGANVIEYVRNGSGRLTINGLAHGLGDYLQSGNWDVIVFQAYDHLFRDALLISDKLLAKKIVVSHGYPGLIRYPVRKFPWGYASMLRRFLRGIGMVRWLPKLDRVVYLSEHADLKGFYDHWLARISGYPGRRVIPNGIDADERGSDPQGFRKQYGISDDAMLFLCVANYSPRKDQAYAARAFRRAAIPNSRLVFIGSSINQHAEKFIRDDISMAKRGEEKHVIWLDHIDRKSTLNAFEACDAFVLSALHEAQPISLLEAMRAQKPWIARKSGCIHLMEGGICVKSEKAMSQAMQSLASNPELRQKIAHEGRMTLEKKYNRKAYSKAYVDLVREVTTIP